MRRRAYKILLTSLSMSALVPAGSMAQEFNAKTFEESVNERLVELPGIKFEVDENLFKPKDLPSLKGAYEQWTSDAIRNAPNFGFVVYDEQGRAFDIVGGDVPFTETDNQINIAGYQLPEGYTVKTVGKAGYVDAAAQIAESRLVDAPSDDVAQAVRTVKGASGYIVQELCNATGRPTEIVLNLTAGFKLAFNVETGSKFTWDLEVVCSR